MIFTVGHSTQKIESFLKFLKANNVTAIADVRSSPYSRYASQFNRETLKDSLTSVGIEYIFMGQELGARSKNEYCYDNNVVNYKRLQNTQEFKSGIDSLIEKSKRYKVATMCSERDPTKCHRTILISKVLSENKIQVSHILGDGIIEPHKKTMLRVVDILGMPQKDLFYSEDELIAEAYKRREKQIAYKRKESP